jgi:hypothetical protein
MNVREGDRISAVALVVESQAAEGASGDAGEGDVTADAPPAQDELPAADASDDVA